MVGSVRLWLSILYAASMLWATSTQAQVNDPASREPRIWETREYTDPYLYYATFLSRAGVVPLQEGNSRRDALQLFQTGPFGGRFIIVQVVVNNNQNVLVTYIEPEKTAGRIRRTTKTVKDIDKADTIKEFVRVQELASERARIGPEIVCIDGSTWRFALRVKGVVTTGRVDDCGVPEFDSLGFRLIKGREFDNSIERDWDLWQD